MCPLKVSGSSPRVSVNEYTGRIYTEQVEEMVTHLRFIIYINITFFSFKAEFEFTCTLSVNDIPSLRSILEAVFHLRALLNKNKGSPLLMSYNYQIPGYWETKANAMELGAMNLWQQLGAISEWQRPITDL